MPESIFRSMCVACVLVVLSVAAAAETHTDHAHDALEVDASLTLDEVLDTALAAYPATPVLEAQQANADAWVRRGRSLTGDRPSLMLRYQSDRWGSDVGLDEYEAGIELPLWAWGGRSAVKSFGAAMSAEAEAARMALRWEVAGRVREALWRVAVAENAHELAEQSLATATRLVASVERRYELGDVAQRDLLLARSSYLDYETALIEASAALMDAERAYRTITGLHRRPTFVAEDLSPAAEIPIAHPLLALADIVVVRAEADVAVETLANKSGASVLLGTRRERPALGTEFDDSIGITVSVPFGGGSHRNTDITAAVRMAAQARSERNRQLRQLTLAMHEAAHGIAVVRANFAKAAQRLEIAERHEAMAETGYEKGELELLDLLMIKEVAISARRKAMRLQIEEKREIALYNQAVGELP